MYIALTLAISSNSHCFAQTITCNPLLLLIEGANTSMVRSKTTDGTSMENLASDIVEEFNEANISVVVMDNDLYWSGGNFFQRDELEKAVDKIKSSRFNPIVIVGHSLGGATAFSLADYIGVNLIVTLDPVSYDSTVVNLEISEIFEITLGPVYLWVPRLIRSTLDGPPPQHERKPYGARAWINVWGTNDNWTMKNLGKQVIEIEFPKWEHQYHADFNLNLNNEVDHSDVKAMWKRKTGSFGSVRDAVLNALSCDEYNYADNIIFYPNELCGLDSIGCKYKFKYEDEYGIGPIEIKLSEIGITGKVLKTGEEMIYPDTQFKKNTYIWQCDNPANRVCHNLDQDNCLPDSNNCCTLCSLGQEIDNEINKVGIGISTGRGIGGGGGGGCARLGCVQQIL